MTTPLQQEQKKPKLEAIATLLSSLTDEECSEMSRNLDRFFPRHVRERIFANMCSCCKKSSAGIRECCEDMVGERTAVLCDSCRSYCIACDVHYVRTTADGCVVNSRHDNCVVYRSSAFPTPPRVRRLSSGSRLHLGSLDHDRDYLSDPFRTP